MISIDLFNEPDKEGFEKLLQLDFVEYKGMLFRKHLFDRQFVEEMLEKNKKNAN